MENRTLVTEFIILGFSDWSHLHIILFLTLLPIYLVALVGNLIIMLVISYDANLHVPMYFFLFNLSILDITITSTIMPKLIDICLAGNQSITYLGCFTQLLFFLICAGTEIFLLAVMSYDRYAAICYPLHYVNLMSIRICLQLALISWGVGFLESVVLTGLISRHSFETYNKIDNLFCDPESLLKLSSGATYKTQMAVLVWSFLSGFIPLIFIVVSYICVIYNILKIRSNKRKRKAFSTCSSHLIVITLFFGIILRMYIKPKSIYSNEEDKVLALLYTCLIPTVNPVIYSLRNKDVHAAMHKIKMAIHEPIVRKY